MTDKIGNGAALSPANGTSSTHTNGTSSASHPQPPSALISSTEASSKPGAQPHSQPQYQFADVCYQLRHKVLAFLAKKVPESDKLLHNVQSQVRVSVDVIEQALRQYTLDEISLSYNGGKDCLVLLILILACLPICSEDTKDSENAGPKPSSTTPPRPLSAIYIVPPDPFPEVDEFVDESTADYNLDLARYPLAMRAALDAFLTDRPTVRAIFMGTRRTDPHGEFLTHFTPTDAGWPQFMRVHPVIDWHYAEIWGFIRHFDIPFCELYNKGFTSLGGTTDTRPNPVLAKGGAGSSGASSNGEGTSPPFRPAYELMDDDEERLGRGR
ncbi:fad synthetase [Ophiostoma piceae UAMH 11346]|uniref:FAD synthase n=1 Tax=Ophiostoma piceae (strain UAMH 11346) TaxID=1262450 RepID=S3C2D4_OPHP1|nr:fad synthetase [Ophiostoma piceae UAMH 11346]